MKISRLFRIFLISVLVFVLAFILVSCKKSESNPTGPTNSGTSNSGFITTPYGTFPSGGATNIKGILATVYASGTVSGLCLFFGATQQQFVYAGDVSVNSNLLDTMSYSGLVIYMKSNLTNVAFNGSVHNWTVAGSGSISAFTASVTSPNGGIALTAPTAGAVVTRSSGLTVTWTPSTTDSVIVMVSDMSGNTATVTATGNSYTFTTASLASLSAGVGAVEVSRFKYAIKTVGSDNFIILATAADEKSITLN